MFIFESPILKKMKKMKKIYLLLLLNSLIGIAQIPAGYYDTATGTDYTLKTNLHNIIKNHTIVSGAPGYANLWTTYQTSDRDVFTGAGYENDNTIYDIYTENPTGSAGECGFIYGTSQDTGSGGGSECQVYNREHIIPQSVFAQASPMRNDAHFIPPTDKRVNALRADFPHGNVATASTTTNNGGKLGTSAVPGYVGTVFEPNPAFKGDIARMYFYFATCYENTVATYNYEMFNNTSNQVFNPVFLNMLISWHQADPVSEFEITRNNAIYARQGNRNPYIDHPEYVCQIWTTQCTALSNEDFADNKFSIYPNPSKGTFRIDYDSSIGDINVEIYSTVGQKVFEKQNINDNTVSTSGLQTGVYFVKINKDSKSIVKKIVID